jgi:hypothetical protein
VEALLSQVTRSSARGVEALLSRNSQIKMNPSLRWIDERGQELDDQLRC